MKPPRPKAHLLISESPLKSGQDHQAYCSTDRKPVMVMNANWVWTGEEVATMEDFFKKLGELCSKCREKYMASCQDPKRVNVYGAVQGREETV